MQTRIQKITSNTENRIIVISDIHGYAHYLDGLLKKLNYTNNDNLVIIGDLIEKGPYSLETLRSVIKLKKANPNVYVSMGNVEYSRISPFFNNSDKGNEDFLNSLQFAKKVWKKGLFLDMLKELGMDLDSITIDNINSVKEKLLNNYNEELNFLWELPTIITCKNFIFVHAGIDTEDLKELEANEAFKYLKVDEFLKKDVHFNKCVVAGHWPVCLYDSGIDNLTPVFDYDKQIIAIDGGCALKFGAQLNALIIPNENATMNEVITECYDDYPVIIADKPQSEKASTVCIKYFDSQVEIVEDLKDAARVKHVSSGRTFILPKDYLFNKGENIHTYDFNDNCLEVNKGDKLSVISQTLYGAIVKKDGKIGWYMNK